MSDKTTEPLRPYTAKTIESASKMLPREVPDPYNLGQTRTVDAAPSPQTTLPICPNNHMCWGCSGENGVDCIKPQTTPTQDEIMRLHDLAVSARFRELNDWPADPDGARTALAAAVGRLVAERDDLKRTVEYCSDAVNKSHDRAEKAERERDALKGGTDNPPAAFGIALGKK